MILPNTLVHLQKNQEMRKNLYRFNPWWEQPTEFPEQLHEREALNQLRQQLDNKQIIFITGLRRIGKSSLMKLMIREIIQSGQKAQHCLYVSLDDYNLLQYSILYIIEEYRSINKLKNDEFVYLFLDEITFAKDFSIQLKNLYDQGHCKIFASSSSSSLMKDQQALLTGRSSTIEILPLNFDEFLKFRNIKIKIADQHLFKDYFNEYLSAGGIPEYVLSNDDAYIRELMDNIIYKDIAALHGIRSLQQLKDYFLLLMERSGKTLSINKIAKILGISTDTSKRYFELFCSTYIIHPVSRNGKLNEQLVSPKKVYACDTGIRTYYTGQRDWGSLFENYVYLRIKHKKPGYIYENQTEIDFLTEDKDLIECKFHNEELSKKQQALYDKFPARNKFIMREEADIENYLKTH